MINNIVIINDSGFVSGGVGKVAIESALALAQKYHVILFCGLKPLDERLHASGVEVVCANLHHILTDKNRLRAIKNGLWNSKSRKLLSSLLSTLSPSDTIVHIHGWNKSLSPSILSLLKKSEFHVVMTLHDYSLFCPSGGFFNYRTHLNCNLKPLSFRCFSCNCDSRNYLQKVYRFIRQIFVFYSIKGKKHNLYALNVSDLSGKIMKKYTDKFFSMSRTVWNPVKLNESGEYVDITKNQKYLFIGRLSEEKGIRDFCEVIADNNLQGMVVGNGYLMEEMKAKYPNIEFVGWMDDVAIKKYIRMAKCLVFPSIVRETFGLAIPEMLSYGIPCIMPTDCGATPLIHDGINGFVYPMGDINALKNCVKKLENANLTTLMESTRKSFDGDQFKMESYVKNFENIINHIYRKG